MKNTIILTIFFIGLISMLSPANAQPVDCLLEVKGKTYIKGSCEFTSMKGGSFQIMGKEYFAQLEIYDEKANGKELGSLSYGTRQAGYVGDVRRKGACWGNEIAKVCVRDISENSSPTHTERVSKTIQSAADVLWPTTQSWYSIQDVPSPTAKAMKTMAAELKDALKSYELKHNVNANCSQIKVLSYSTKQGDYNSFHLLDFDGDGFNDLIYAGDSIGGCGAGGAPDDSIVWHGGKGGFEVWNVFSNEKMLRISPTGQVFTSVRVAESDDQGDTFFFGKVQGDKSFREQFWVYHDTQLPSETLEEVKPFYYDHKSILRWSPIEDNKPDNKDSIRQVSGVLGEYVIGNQMKRYKAGAYGTVLAQQRDQQGNMWSFVLIDGLEESSVFGEVSQPGWVWEGKAPQNEVATKHQTKDKNPTEKAAEQKVPETELGRLVNDFTGSSRCLRSTSNGQVALLPCSSNRNDNRWILAPSNQQGFAILKRQSVDSNQCLTLEDSGRMLMKACNPAANGQMWGFTMWQGDDHRARIQNILFGEQWCLDVINDGTNNRVHMAECGNYSGQAWGE